MVWDQTNTKPTRNPKPYQHFSTTVPAFVRNFSNNYQTLLSFSQHKTNQHQRRVNLNKTWERDCRQRNTSELIPSPSVCAFPPRRIPPSQHRAITKGGAAAEGNIATEAALPLVSEAAPPLVPEAALPLSLAALPQFTKLNVIFRLNRSKLTQFASLAS